MSIECCGSGKHITLVTLVKMKMECVRHMIKNHEDAAAVYVLKHVFQFRFILMHLFTLLCYLTIVHWSSYFCSIFLAIFFNSLQQHVANIWPLYCPLLYEIFVHAIIVQTLHSESTCVCQYWLLFVVFFAFNWCTDKGTRSGNQMRGFFSSWPLHLSSSLLNLAVGIHLGVLLSLEGAKS